MFTLADITVDQFVIWILVFARITSMLAFLPLLRSGQVPAIAKIGIALALSMVIIPALPKESLEIPASLTGFSIMFMKEVFIGLIIGYLCSLVFAGVQFAGQTLDHHMGFAMVQIIDPDSDSHVSVVGQFQTLIFTIIFLTIGAHLYFIKAVGDSFQLIAINGLTLTNPQFIKEFINMSAKLFVIAIKISAPVLVVLLLSEVALGILARTMPQMNIFVVGLPLKIGVGLLALIFSLPVMFRVFEFVIQDLLASIYRVMALIG